ncbi:hypothetical protein DE146DRAFT_419928 [Phaeosphaeria sp. MPI-PUGE-AT-0046c]|nr:hypothetical protein DE146DRAFT_419928 [Phaeosphaeria sp. MPI-PUGE-AT-0046c]
MSSPSTTPTLLSFLALYLTTLFSLDAWSSALNSPYRAPGSTSFARPSGGGAPSTYQAGMHGRGRRGAGSGGGGGSGRNVGEVARDTRPPVGMGVSAGCGACMT